ncbi:MAG: relaxase/mobilization nuclease RlxS [Rhizomicrobium sp.]
MAGDDDFEPRLGRIRSGGSKKAAGYLRRVLRAVSLAGSRSGRTSTFQGNRIGRGAGAGRVLTQRDRYAAFRTRRVVIKTRVVKFKGQGLKAAQLHLRYIQRDGVTRDGAPGALYDRQGDSADGRAFLERSDGDRHQFRFIVAPEDGGEYDDLKPLVRRLMVQMEDDLGTRLDWVAVDHHNTGHPHTHVVLRGKDELDRDLVIAREYIAHGMRERAAEIVSLDLGPKTDVEIDDQLRQQVEQERFTDLDKALRRQAGDTGEITFDKAGSGIAHHHRAGRLQKLAKLGLADEVAPGHWRLQDDMEPVLRRMGERGDIIKAMHRELSSAGVERGVGHYAIFDPAAHAETPLIGRVVAGGIADEDKDSHFVVLDGVDGRAHYVDIGSGESGEPPPGSIIAVRAAKAEARQADRTIAAIAERNGGVYSVASHQRFDPSAGREFVEAHVRRLEAMRREGGHAERHTDGTWTVPKDFVERGLTHDQSRGKSRPVALETLSSLPLEKLECIGGATWLDRELTAERPAALRDLGFGADVQKAMERRRQWLIAEGLAREAGGATLYRASMLAELRTRELAKASADLARTLKKPYMAAPGTGKIEGVFRGPVELASGKFAIIEKARDFTLVPWRPVLERSLGQSVSGIVRGEAISWSIGRHRGQTIS